MTIDVRLRVKFCFIMIRFFECGSKRLSEFLNRINYLVGYSLGRIGSTK